MGAEFLKVLRMPLLEWLKDARFRLLTSISLLWLALYREFALAGPFGNDSIVQRIYPYVPLALATLLFPRRFWIYILLGFSLLNLLFQPLYLWSTRNPIVGRNILAMILSDLSGVPEKFPWFNVIPYYVCALAAIYLLYRTFYPWVRQRSPFLSMGAGLAMCWVLFSQAAPFMVGYAQILVFLVLAGLSRSLASYSLFSLESPKRCFTATDTLWVLPFWQPEIPMWVPKPLQIKDQVHVNQFKIWLEIALLCFLLWLWREVFSRVFSPSHLGIQNLYTLGFSSIENDRNLYAAAWVTILMSGLNFLIETLWIKGMVVYFLLRAIGFPTLRPIRNPFTPYSFYDFFSRLYFFYNRAIVLLVYYPLYGALRKFHLSARGRKYLALSISVCSFTFLFHSLRDYWVFLPGRIHGSIGAYFFTMLCYSLALAGIVLCSVALEQNQLRPLLLRILSAPIYFVLFCLLLFFGTGHFDDVAVKLRTIRFLFSGVY